MCDLSLGNGKCNRDWICEDLQGTSTLRNCNTKNQIQYVSLPSQLVTGSLFRTEMGWPHAFVEINFESVSITKNCCLFCESGCANVCVHHHGIFRWSYVGD